MRAQSVLAGVEVLHFVSGIRIDLLDLGNGKPLELSALSRPPIRPESVPVSETGNEILNNPASWALERVVVRFCGLVARSDDHRLADEVLASERRIARVTC